MGTLHLLSMYSCEFLSKFPWRPWSGSLEQMLSMQEVSNSLLAVLDCGLRPESLFYQLLTIVLAWQAVNLLIQRSSCSWRVLLASASAKAFYCSIRIATSSIRIMPGSAVLSCVHKSLLYYVTFPTGDT